MKLEFSRQIFENVQSNSIKIRPVRAEMFHADRRTDRQTDMTNPTVAIAILPTCLKKSPEFYIHNSVDFLEDPDVDRKDNIKIDLQEVGWEARTGLIWCRI